MIPFSGLNDRATTPAALPPRAVDGCGPSQYFNSLLRAVSKAGSIDLFNSQSGQHCYFSSILPRPT